MNVIVRIQPFEEERSYYHHLRMLEEAGKRSYLVYDTETGSVRRDTLTVPQAVCWIARASDVPIIRRGRYENHTVDILRGDDFVWTHPVPLEWEEEHGGWPKIFEVLLRESPVRSRYRAASIEQARRSIQTMQR